MKKWILLFIGTIVPVFCIHAQALYKDGHGGFVYLPNGKISFADVLVSVTEGDPKCDMNDTQGWGAIGEADFNIQTQLGRYSLGCGGNIVLAFTNNALVDINGPDLYVFEVGWGIEETQLEISKDGIHWINVGKIAGGRAEVDIKDYVQPDETFYYVKLTDLKSACGGGWPGADIDAVAAIGSVLQVTLNSSLLFDVGSYKLKTAALLSIDSLVTRLNSLSIKSIDIQGHCDNVGSDDLNLTLSQNRANAVKDYLLKKLSDKTIVIHSTGYGETQPIATNETEDGRKANRRVSLTINPKEYSPDDKSKFEELTNVTYIACKLDLGQWLDDYPKAVNQANFPDLYTGHLDDALVYSGNTYFFNGSKVKVFNNTTKKMDPAEKNISEIFPGVTFDRIDASVYMKDRSKICFIKDDDCIMYEPSTKRTNAYKVSAIFPTLGTTHPKAIRATDGQHLLFFFEGYTQVFNVSTKKVEGAPVLMSSTNWGNLRLEAPAAIMDDGSGVVIFFYNPQL